MNKKLLLLVAVFFCFVIPAVAQTFTGTGDTIPDDGSSIDFIISVTGLPNSIDTTNFGFESVCLDITHTYDSDLDIYIVAPDGTMALLTSANGGSGHNYTATCFNQTAATSITQGNPPFTGTFRPQGQMGVVNNGQNPNGNWKLHIQDTYPFADYGILNNWSITFGNSPAAGFFLSSSNLPIVIINTFGQAIPNDPKITAHLGIIDNGTGNINYVTDSMNNYNGMIGIEVRGNSSQMFPQKQYSMETRDTAGNNLNTVLLGMPSEHDWILYAPYDDKSCMRNSLTYTLSNDMGHYAVRTKFCEMILNGQYNGIYTLTETIKRDSNRVNIAKLTANDTTGDDLTGGYISKIDWINGNNFWVSTYPPDPVNTLTNQIKFQYVYPKDADILPVQQNYIQLFVDSFEDAMASATFYNPLTGWRKYADENSVIDFFIINEMSKNVDAYRLSTYFYKDKSSKGGKIHAGPVWDFNLAWHNADYCNNASTSGWAYRITDFCQADIPFWWKRLMLDGQFKNNLKCRWMSLRTSVLDTTYIFNYMDSIATLLDQAKDRHFTQWPILGTYVWPNPSPLANTYQEELDHMKQWIIARFAWLDNNIPGTCISTGEQEQSASAEFNVYPNPAGDLITIDAFHRFNKNAVVKIYDALGEKVLHETFVTGKWGDDTFSVNIHDIRSGIYFVIVYDSDQMTGVRKLIKL